MEAIVSEWLNLLVRWVHLVAGVMWIGSSIFFTWMNAHFEKPEDGREGVEGELWMVHGGGFYVVEKKHVAPDKLPRNLHWFKWEAMFTMLSGLLLLTLVFYMGGGVLMIDPATAKVSAQAAIGVGVAAVVLWWFLYDALWRTSFAKQNNSVAAAVSFVVACAIAWGLSQVLSGRAAYIHVGAMLGVSMVLNVWVHIIPGQRALVEATKAGRKPDPEQGKRGKTRSLHNHYMTYPVLFIMLSSHFPSTYGSPWNWAILAGLALVSMGVKHWLNVREPGPQVLLAALAAALFVGATTPLVARLTAEQERVEAAAASAAAPQGKPIDAATAGSVRGVVRFAGEVPPPKEVSLYGGCEKGHDGRVRLQPVQVKDGLLKDAFVFVKRGVEGYAVPPPPSTEVVVDQKLCLYEPRIVGARVGQPVTFVNSDPLFHNVRSVAEQNQTWSINMPAQEQRETRTFKKPEVMVQTRCDVHPWMVAYVGVVAHPFFQVTGDDGAFALSGLPPGEHAIEVWHEALGRKEAVVTVPPSGTAEIVFDMTSAQGGAP